MKNLSTLLVLTTLDILVLGNGMHNIHWNSTNPLFHPNTENIIQVNGGNHPWEYDQVNIVCPVYRPGATREAMQEKYIIYSVTKQEYDTCRITEANPRIIAVCDRPHELMYFTITFRSFTPTPGGLEFRPGHSYYFISTSSKSDIHRRVGGGCSTHNMKITFKVAEASTKPILTIEENNQLEDSQSSIRGRESFFPLLKSKQQVQQQQQQKPATLYYPLHEIAQMKEFFFKKQRKNSVLFSKMQGDDPRIGLAANAESSSTRMRFTWEMLLLIISMRAITL